MIFPTTEGKECTSETEMTIDGRMARGFTSSAETVESPVLWHSPRILLCNEACVTASTSRYTYHFFLARRCAVQTVAIVSHETFGVADSVSSRFRQTPTIFPISSYANIQSVLFYLSSPAAISILFVTLLSFPLFFFGFWVCYWSSGRHYYNGVYDLICCMYMSFDFCGRGVVYRHAHGKVSGVLLGELY